MELNLLAPTLFKSPFIAFLNWSGMFPYKIRLIQSRFLHRPALIPLPGFSCQVLLRVYNCRSGAIVAFGV